MKAPSCALGDSDDCENPLPCAVGLKDESGKENGGGEEWWEEGQRQALK